MWTPGIPGSTRALCRPRGHFAGIRLQRRSRRAFGPDSHHQVGRQGNPFALVRPVGTRDPCDPHDPSRLRGRGRTPRLRRAHQRARQQPYARLRDPSRVRPRRRRSLQQGSDRPGRASPEQPRLLQARPHHQRAGLRTRPGGRERRCRGSEHRRVLGLGRYSTSDGFIGEVSVTESNFLGRGQFVRVAGSYGQRSQGVDFSFTEPYFLGYRLAAGFDLFSKFSDQTKLRATKTRWPAASFDSVCRSPKSSA